MPNAKICLDLILSLCLLILVVEVWLPPLVEEDRKINVGCSLVTGFHIKSLPVQELDRTTLKLGPV